MQHPSGHLMFYPLSRFAWRLAVLVSLLIRASAGLADVAGDEHALPITGDGQTLWVVQPTSGERPGFTILIRQRAAEDAWLRRLATLQGRIAPNGLAATADRLWMVFEDRSVQTLTLRQPTRPREPMGYDLSRQASLPEGVALRSLAAGQDHVWALVRVINAEALRRIDAMDIPAQETDRFRPPRVRFLPAIPGLPRSPDDPESVVPGVPLPPAPAAADEGATEEDAQAPVEPETVADPLPVVGPGTFIPVDRLLRRHGGQWVRQDLPEGWTDPDSAWLVVSDTARNRLNLVSLEADGQTVQLHQQVAQGWRERSYDLAMPVQAARDLRALALPPHVAIAQRVTNVGALTAEFSVLTPEGLVRLGQIALNLPSDQPWAVVSFGHAAALLAYSGDETLTWARLGDDGAIVESSTPIFEHRESPLANALDSIILIGVLVLATLVMFLFWRRDPQWNQLDLPEDVALADLAKRALAGVIDLAPCLLIGLVAFDADAQTVFQYWPGRGGGWEGNLPGAAVIGLFVVYSLLAELFTGRTVGKAMMGLRVTAMNGSPPNVWQVLLRNVTKTFDLIAWLLLILPLIGPYRQRLGDLVARTVVVSSVPPSHDETVDDLDDDDDDRPRDDAASDKKADDGKSGGPSDP